MQSLLDTFKTLKPWQIGVLAAALAGAVGATYGVYTVVTDSGSDGLAENQQLIPVTRGDLVNDVSINGSLVFPDRDTLDFGIQGTIGEVLVDEGQEVNEGQTLASLDAETIRNLEKAVAQAELNLRDAKDALTKAQDPHTPLDIAQAEAKVANAKLTLDDAQESLARLLEPSAQDVAQAETAVVNARISVEEAHEAKNALISGPSDEDIAKAQAQVDSANVALSNAERDLKLAQKAWSDKVQVAQDAVHSALGDYRAVFDMWLGIGLGNEEADISPDELLESWGADLVSLFDPNSRFQGLSNQGIPSDDPTTPWNEFVVYAWVNFYPAAIAPTCEDGAVPFEGACIKKELDEAWDNYQEAKDNLDTIETQAANATANAETAITRVEENLVTATEALAELREAPDPLQIESREKQLELALITLQMAEEDLSKIENGPDETDVESKQKQVEVAIASLAETEDELAELRGSVDPLIVALREAEVAAAQASLDAALERIGNAVIKAPWGGIVSIVNVEIGQTVNANAPVVEIVDPTVIEVDGVVDEIDVLFIREGAEASVTMDALPGQTLDGTVSSIAASAQSQQGVVSYPITIRVQTPQGLDLPEGLSAVANVVIREDLEVLLVPLDSLYGTFEQPVVRLMNDGSVEERHVVLGNYDDFWVVVQEGLSEGELVVIESEGAATTGFGFGRGLTGGGGFGGGGGFTGGGRPPGGGPE